MQPRFSRLLLLLPFFLVLEASVEDERPNRKPRHPAFAQISAAPLAPLPLEPGQMKVAGLWQLTSSEPRFGGLSALAITGGDFLAVTDSGAVVRWPMQGGSGRFRDLPAGPGRPQWKIHRDSEAMVRDPAGRGWWIAFEQFHSLFLFDDTFARPLERRPVQVRTWWRNWGIEALTTDDSNRIVLLPENGRSVIRLERGGSSRQSLDAPGQVADAVRLTDGRTAVALRRIRPWGITNSLGWLKRTSAGYRVEPWGELPLGQWDNVEGLAAEPLADGSQRLWFVTDSDFKRRTILGWVHVTKAPAKTGA